ncbi:MAG TPA: hypothetical protein VKV37_10385 [Ktedonobacteraceae bacterium]|nr:hypothetical protein [Ktedonobacteraceae bacterium]
MQEQEDAARAAFYQETIEDCEESIGAITRGEWDAQLAHWGRSREEVIAAQQSRIQAVEAILSDLRAGLSLLPCAEPECPQYVSQRTAVCPWCGHAVPARNS